MHEIKQVKYSAHVLSAAIVIAVTRTTFLNLNNSRGRLSSGEITCCPTELNFSVLAFEA